MILGFQVYGKDMFPVFRVINHKMKKIWQGYIYIFFLFKPKLQSDFTGQDSKGVKNFPDVIFLDQKIIYETANEFTVLLIKETK